MRCVIACLSLLLSVSACDGSRDPAVDNPDSAVDTGTDTDPGMRPWRGRNVVPTVDTATAITTESTTAIETTTTTTVDAMDPVDVPDARVSAEVPGAPPPLPDAATPNKDTAAAVCVRSCGNFCFSCAGDIAICIRIKAQPAADCSETWTVYNVDPRTHVGLGDPVEKSLPAGVCPSPAFVDGLFGAHDCQWFSS